MAKYQFASLDGYSRVSMRELIDIVEHGGFDQEVRDVLTSFDRGNFTDYTWIAGEDRAAFAAVLGRALLTAPEQDLGIYGEALKAKPELMRRWPSLKSVVEHLASDSVNPMVITYDVTGYFPHEDFATAEWKAANRKDRDEAFERLPDADKWALTLPWLMAEHVDDRWRRGLSPSALQNAEDDDQLGLGMTLAVESPFRNDVMKTETREELEAVLDKLGGEMLEWLDGQIAIGDTPYFVGNTLDSAYLLDPVGIRHLEKCAGFSSFDVMLLDGNPFSEAIPREKLSWKPKTPANRLIIVQSTVSRAAEVREMIKAVDPDGVFERILLVTGLANQPQMFTLLKEFPALQIAPFEVTPGNIREVRDHIEKIGKLKRVKPVKREMLFSTLFRRQQERKAEAREE